MSGLHVMSYNLTNCADDSDQEQVMKRMYNIGDAATLNIYTLTCVPMS